MKKFFVPSKWEKNTETIKFATFKGNLSGNENIGQKAEDAKTKKKKNKNKKTKQKAKDTSTKGIASAPTPQNTPISKVKGGRIEKKKKNKKQKLQLTPAAAQAAVELLNETPNTSRARESLQSKFKEQLMGGRFRFLNEQLYTIDSLEAQQLFQEDPDAFGAYHEGYRHQVEKWPLNPLDRIVKMIRKLPKSLEIGDFGCGEGKLAKSIPNKVYSMDLVSCRDDILACDMANTSLPPQTLDVAVYCLSLMGINLNDYLLEANRVLKMGGLVYIAEIQSRFENVYSFIKCLEGCGFELVKKDVSVKLFYFFQFKKVANVGKVVRLKPFSLKPCLYRKR